MELISDRASRSLKTKYLGVIPSEVLEFDLEILCETEISLFQSDMIKSWLFGQIKPKKLFIINSEMNDIYFNCILNNPEDININGNNGWKFTVVCDAGGAWQLPITKRFVPNSENGTFLFNNISGNNDYTYPNVSFKLGASETGFIIVNQSDNNRSFEFSGLSNSEIISINGETKVITSSCGLNRLEKFNKNYLRFIRGANTLVCNGAIEYLDITIQNFRRVGG